jgi:hypothetical protein
MHQQRMNLLQKVKRLNKNCFNKKRNGTICAVFFRIPSAAAWAVAEGACSSPEDVGGPLEHPALPTEDREPHSGVRGHEDSRGASALLVGFQRGVKLIDGDAGRIHPLEERGKCLTILALGDSLDERRDGGWAGDVVLPTVEGALGVVNRGEKRTLVHECLLVICSI